MISEKDYLRLKKHYNEALTKNIPVFVFDHQILVTFYAGFIMENLNKVFKPK
jgi:hypothetical protein